MGRVFDFIKWLVWDFSGLRYIWGKILPPVDTLTNERRPVTFLLWVIGLYAALFGIASQRYENRIDIIENRANAIFAQLSSPAYKKVLSRIPIVQNMQCPQKPEILKPLSVFRSLLGEENKYKEIVTVLRDIVENWKFDLVSVDLDEAILDGANLSGANLKLATLRGANLRNTDLKMANLESADLTGAKLENSNLREADFKLSNLNGSNLKNCNLRWTNFGNANLSNADLEGSDISGANFRQANLANATLTSIRVVTLSSEKAPPDLYQQLSEAGDLQNIKVNSLIETKLKKNYPALFTDREGPMPAVIRDERDY